MTTRQSATEHTPSSTSSALHAEEQRRRAFLAMMAVVLIWGINVSVMKNALTEVTPLAFNALRFPLAVLVLGLFMLRNENQIRPKRDEWPRLLLLGFTAHPIYQSFFLGGLSLTSASHTAVLISTTPVWIALGDHYILKERLPRVAWLGIGFSVFGVLVLTLVRGNGGSDSSIRGDILVLISCVIWTVYVIGSRPMLKHRSPIWVTGWAMFIGATVVVLMGIPDLLRTDWKSLTAASWGGAVYAGLFALATSYSWWAYSVKIVGASRTAVFANLIPVVAITVAWFWLGEILPLLALAGAGVTLLGVWITTRSRSLSRA